jgi:predicted metalloprotease
MGGVGLGGGGIGLILVVLAAAYFGIDPTVLLQGMGGAVQEQGPSMTTEQRQPSAADDEMKQFMSVVLADTEDTWGALFEQSGKHKWRVRSIVRTSNGTVLLSDGVISLDGRAYKGTLTPWE